MQQQRTESVMGAAETRALWQRMASRCCVQEDLKRAPKIACCQQQLSVASAKFVDLEPSADTLSSGSFEDASYCSDFSADKKWWLKGSTDQQFTSLEEELEILNPGLMNSHLEDIKCKKMHEFVDLMETREEYASMKTSIAGQLNEMYFEPLKSPWVPSKKSAPWWRTTDKDELALLVATKSLDHIQNCDLPQPQTVRKRIHCLSDNTKRSGSLSSSPIQDTGFQESVKTSWQRVAWDMEHGVEKSLSDSSTCSKNTSPKSPGNDLNKAQLLEALCHSQTRAREAEEAAREAYTEKDHIITILFRQASQLFAYEPTCSTRRSLPADEKQREAGLRKKREEEMAEKQKGGDWEICGGFCIGLQPNWCWFALGLDCGLAIAFLEGSRIFLFWG